MTRSPRSRSRKPLNLADCRDLEVDPILEKNTRYGGVHEVRLGLVDDVRSGDDEPVGATEHLGDGVRGPLPELPAERCGGFLAAVPVPTIEADADVLRKPSEPVVVRPAVGTPGLADEIAEDGVVAVGDDVVVGQDVVLVARAAMDPRAQGTRRDLGMADGIAGRARTTLLRQGLRADIHHVGECLDLTVLDDVGVDASNAARDELARWNLRLGEFFLDADDDADLVGADAAFVFETDTDRNDVGVGLQLSLSIGTGRTMCFRDLRHSRTIHQARSWRV